MGSALTIFLLWIQLLPVVYSESSLQMLILNQFRTPTVNLISYDLQNSPLWPGLGQLTPAGMRAEFEFGQKLRSRYIDGFKEGEQYHFLQPHFKSSDIYARSIDEPAAIESLTCQMYGMYMGMGKMESGEMVLPHGFTPVPVHTVPVEQDSLLLAAENCPALEDEWYYIINSKEWVEKKLEHKELISFLSRVFGKKVTLETWIEDVYGPLSFKVKYKEELPAGVTLQNVHEVITIGDWVVRVFCVAVLDPLAKLSRMFANTQVGRLSGGLLLLKIKELMDEKISNSVSNTPKLFIYSANEKTLLGLLAALTISYGHIPYSSSVTFELHKSVVEQGPKAGEEVFSVKVMYNDEVITTHVGRCTGEYCYYPAFWNYIMPAIDDLDWEGECERTIKPISKNIRIRPIWYLIAGFLPFSICMWYINSFFKFRFPYATNLKRLWKRRRSKYVK